MPANDPTPRIDSHVHVFPDRLALAVRDALNRGGLLQADPLLAGVARRVGDEGFDFAWALPYAHRAGIAEAVNEWSAAEASLHPALVPGATFHPDDPDIARLVERALVELRLRVVKLHCAVGAFSSSDARLGPLWEAAEHLHVPVVVHAGRAGGDTARDDLDAVIPVLERHAALPLVLAHCGHPEESRALELMREFPNLYADLTPVWTSPVEVPDEGLRAMPGRFLFGSDAPNNPAGAADLASRLESRGLEPSAVAMIVGANAAALIASGQER